MHGYSPHIYLHVYGSFECLFYFAFFNEQQSAGNGVNVTQANKTDWIKADVCLQLKLFS